MPRGLPKATRSHLEKAIAAALAAVEVYNKPGSHFRTCHFVILINLAWTALFHAIFYQRDEKPWYKKGKRYERVDGEPKHWELGECANRYWGDQNPPERANLRFLLGLRNKVEHRELPLLDATIYGECQASLLNFEKLLASTFGEKYSLVGSLALALQFSHVSPDAQKKAIQSMLATAASDVRHYIESFRASLPAEVLQCQAYSFSVYLVPKIANRESAASVCVEFVPYDETKPEEMAELEKLTSLLKDRQVPVANLDRFKPSQVIQSVQARLPYKINSHTHTQAWRHFKIRPASHAANPASTKTQYCVYDKLHGDYSYTKAWIDKLATELADPATYAKVTGKVAQELEQVEVAQ